MPVFVIARREIRDQFRDWRIIIPILTLTLLFPGIMNFTAEQAVQFVEKYGANLIGERLIPFLLMVVGFFPISISLVIVPQRRKLAANTIPNMTTLQTGHHLRGDAPMVATSCSSAFGVSDMDPGLSLARTPVFTVTARTPDHSPGPPRYLERETPSSTGR